MTAKDDRVSSTSAGGRLKAALPVALALAAAVGCAGYAAWFFGAEGALPRATRSSARDSMRENQACEGCHADVAAEWRSSQHRTAFTDPTFQKALAVEPKAFCRDCHAPEDPDAARPDGPQTLGVACVTCHLAGDAVLAAPKPGLSRAPHRVARMAAFGSAAACAGCHEFSFGDDERREAPLLMQRTAAEHAASDHADRSCADCHMPRGAGGRRSHAFASTRDPASHERAIVARVERTGETSLRVELEAIGVGHAYPTGDLFRRVAVEAEVVGSDYQRIASAERFLGRHFTTGTDLRGEPIRVEVRDNRVGARPGERTVVDLQLGERARGFPIGWRVSLDRVLHVSDHREAAAVIGDRVVLASGEVAP